MFDEISVGICAIP